MQVAEVQVAEVARPSSSTAKKVRQLAPLNQVRAAIAAKISADLMRFRTCCADVRASK
jgi:hypothetical protein